MINVNRGTSDLFYRYKMPVLIAKVEGKGNGIKTVVVNMVEIGKALNRPASFPCKYFGCELGAQTQMDDKKGRYVVNGAHEGVRLQELLDGFIKKFVLCPECENPETELQVQIAKSRIVQNTTPTEDSSKAKKDKDKKSRKHGGKGKSDGAASSSPTPDDDMLDAPSHTTNGKNKEEEDDEEDWSVDTKDLEKKESERVNMFFKFVEEIKQKGGVPAVAGSFNKIKAEAERLEVMDKAAGILAELLYNDKLLSQIKEYRPILVPFVYNNRKAQKNLLSAFEQLVGTCYPKELLPKVPLILKSFYDNDLLEEEALQEWADKASKKNPKKEWVGQIYERAAPFIKWLQTAEEESSEEELSEEEEVPSQASAGQQTAGNATSNEPNNTTVEEDLNIDDI
ncbi:hypothetical protein EMCRGX_G032443 [Ephydatia muelleri]